MAAEKNRREQLGEGRPIIHTNARGKKLVSEGNTICSLDPNANFSDFLREDRRVALGPEGWAGEMSKPLIGRHPIAQWQSHAEELLRAETPDDRGCYSITRDGLITAYVTLAYDLYIVKDNIRFQTQILDRLRRREHFAGVRYELLVAATFVRAGFQVEPEDESSSLTHPEFVATHRA